MKICWLPLTLILIFVPLRHQVPNPGGMVSFPSIQDGQSMPGARVTTRTSLGGECIIDLPIHKRPDTKIHEVWATSGYGLIVDPSRCKRIKRSFHRACKRAYKYGCTQYRGKDFWSSNIPFQIRQQLTHESNIPATKVGSSTSMTRTTDSLNIFCWNASNGLLLDEWVTWLTQTSYDVAILQEID